ncbi:undecaprenyl/decaprenyl-phosphate alpha-N-acetylglucosaminyl 1-phosphate transferase [Oceanotoga sp. DSM 15011]|jgi:UDP-GlcNAc:undecaprenyl-phosphate GlcNAc-1-phosphate transferase|uniref:UDP-GlcNAc:undecaprenyl-phosphate GlcNAc-1-phosphate transferase n=1 Tax=Oceanotoga teriensis TaxID=515440 RepID=A0AA45C5X9_9BACT|nr:MULTISPECIES: MraY family glycosyltransferase [Oceanotoga]PWJ90551.1 UDP-GlcNAc:undecaprenyl-phosphate GlcNAc-1-phosphate transferase [Oceanotoga teriensis]UYO99795.1 undecaprenyl/decaprenyl-phosphate alpha-N-acetylglucosaminyl 1-phosphate transferase [Oceanotoga sp. DSM 15011]
MIFIPFFLNILITPFIIKFALKFSIVDKPDNNLKNHKKITPYLGGLSLFLSILPFYFDDLYYIIPAFIIMIIGLFDDIKNINPFFRLFVEFAVITFTVVNFHMGFSIIINILFIITGVALINAVNMIDGMDGLCSGTALISLLFFAIISKNFDILYFVFALLGFLVFNFYPAKIFLGDAGSYLIGFTLFYNFNYLTSKSGFGGYFIGLIITAYFFTDLFFSILRRIMNDKSPFYGDKEHIYDKIRSRFNTKISTTVLINYIIVFSFGLISWFSWFKPYLGIGIAFVLFLFTGVYFRLYKYD